MLSGDIFAVSNYKLLGGWSLGRQPTCKEIFSLSFPLEIILAAVNQGTLANSHTMLLFECV